MSHLIDFSVYKDASGLPLNGPPVTGTIARHRERDEFVIMGTRLAINHKQDGYDLLVAGVCEDKLDHYLTFYREWDRYHIPARPIGCIRVQDELAGHSWELYYDRVSDVYLPRASEQGLPRISPVLTSSGFPLEQLLAPAMSEVFGLGRRWPHEGGADVASTKFVRATEIGCDGDGLFSVIAYAPFDVRQNKGGATDIVVRTEELLNSYGFQAQKLRPH